MVEGLSSCVQGHLVFVCPFLVHLAQFAQLKFLEDLHWGKYEGIDDSSNCECTAHDGTDGGEKMVHGRPGLVVFYRDWIQIVPKNNMEYASDKIRTKLMNIYTYTSHNFAFFR